MGNPFFPRNMFLPRRKGCFLSKISHRASKEFMQHFPCISSNVRFNVCKLMHQSRINLDLTEWLYKKELHGQCIITKCYKSNHWGQMSVVEKNIENKLCVVSLQGDLFRGNNLYSQNYCVSFENRVWILCCYTPSSTLHSLLFNTSVQTD